MTNRPRSVVALALIFLIIALAGIIIGIYLLFFAVPGFQNQIQNDLLFAITTTISPTLLGPFTAQITLLFLLDVPSSLSTMSTYFYSALLALIASVMYFFSGVGLLYMKKWAYYLGLLIGVSDIIGGIVLLVIIVGILFIPVGIIILVYLWRDVKDEFEQG
ncbi:MAG: hypothetical protein WED07_16125 [Candidatus Freyarchaeum deiterrae]